VVVVPRAPRPAPAPLPPANKPLNGPFWVGTSVGGPIHVFNAPNGQPTETLSNPNEAGTARTVLIKDRVSKDWLEAFMPTRPNGHTGFIQASEVNLTSVDTQILVERNLHRLTAWSGDQQIFQSAVAVGKPQWPTPTGIFYLQELIRSPNPRGAYGPFVFGLSAHSDVFESFGGGDGLVGLHGTNEPGSIGRSASHGCIRLPNAGIVNLVNLVNVGTPIVVV
jgi:lipoprotein-anchoring transpeptidase ErfK/SrfK